jgi:AmmeMemoRadiSam system protein A
VFFVVSCFRDLVTSEHDRQLLLRIARDAIAAHVGVTPAHDPGAPGSSDVLARPGGAFVSLHNRGDLRGCIGHIEATEPIGAVVPRCAVAACSSDPRFPHVTPPELEQIDIEISLLGPLEPIAGPQSIEVGRHGLVVEMGSRRGLLLPQVATEWKWDAETFLAQTCHKAGLARDAWRQGAKLWRFEAEVFGER